jgi:hypothetical protein
MEVNVMAIIEPGSKVLARSAFDELLERRAVTGVQPGHDFPVVWVCTEEEWQRASDEGRQPEGLPWPAEDVQLAEEGREVLAS